MDYKKIRKEDIHAPKGSFFQDYILNKFNLLESVVTEIGKNDHSTKLIIYIPGGAFISGPAQHHWNAVKTIVKKTNYKVWICDYPKAPENNIKTISKNIDSIFQKAVEKFSATNIVIIGDSVGGTLATALVQRLLKCEQDVPKKVILLSPVMDSSMTNPEIEKLDKTDPVLSKIGVLSAKKMCIDSNDLKNVMISPLFGSFEGFPETVLLLAENDIMYPDGKLASLKMKKANVKLTVTVGEGMPHIWPVFPIMKEAKTSFNEIVRLL